MIKLELPDESFWAAVGVLGLIAATSFIRFIKWQGVVLTKKEHAKICEDNNKIAKESQDRVIGMLEAQNASAGEYRRTSTEAMTKLTVDVNELKTDVAVLKATQPTINITAKGG